MYHIEDFVPMKFFDSNSVAGQVEEVELKK